MPARSETLALIIRAKSVGEGEVKALNRAFLSVRNTLNAFPKTIFNLKNALVGLGIGYLTRDLVKASDRQAMAIAGLETALKSMGRYTPELSKGLQEVASGLQDITNFGDEAIIEGQKFLVTYKGISDDLLPRTSKAMADLAALMGGDTRQAANMLGKASMGMTGELRRVGITVNAETFKLRGYKGVLAEIEQQVKGQAEAMREATGPWTAIGNLFGDIKEKLGDIIKQATKVFGQDIILLLKVANKHLENFKNTADFSKWAETQGISFLKMFEAAAKGVALLTDIFNGLKMTVEGVKLFINAFLDAFLENIKQKLEVFRFILEKLGLEGIAKKLGDAAKYLEEKQRGFAAAAGKSIEKIDEMAAQEPAYKKVGGFIAKLKKEMESLRKEQEKSVAVLGKIGAPAGTEKIEEDQAALVSRLKETTKTALLELENNYKQGKIKLEQYFQERKALLVKQYEAEIALAKKAAEAEADPAKREELNSKLLALRETFNRELLKLDQKRVDEQKKLEDAELERRKALEDLKARAVADAGGDLQAQFDAEMRALDQKHQEEIRRLIELNATKTELDDAYREQKLEKDKLVADQERRLWEARMNMAKIAASGMKDVFTGLYEMYGKKTKEFFYLAKAAALAESIINTSQAITKALAQGGFWGWAMAIMVGAKGAMEIAKIASQEMASGGLVLGRSPHDKADDKLIAVTSGEYVVNAKAVRRLGIPFLESLNRGFLDAAFGNFTMPGIPRSPRYAFASGGPVTPTSGINGGRQIVIANFYDREEMARFLATAQGQNAVINIMQAKRGVIRKILAS